MPKIQLRHDTSTNWTTYNPVLLEGEVGVEADTNKIKIGDGVKTWSQLDHAGKDTVDQTFDATSTNAQSGTAVAGAIVNKVTGTGITNITKLTQTEYDALTTKDANTFYVIVANNS